MMRREDDDERCDAFATFANDVVDPDNFDWRFHETCSVVGDGARAEAPAPNENGRHSCCRGTVAVNGRRAVFVAQRGGSSDGNGYNSSRGCGATPIVGQYSCNAFSSTTTERGNTFRRGQKAAHQYHSGSPEQLRRP